MLGGVEYSNSLTNWVSYNPSDPVNNMAASWHSYNFNLCNNEQCWDNSIGSVIAAGFPIITGSIELFVNA